MDPRRVAVPLRAAIALADAGDGDFDDVAAMAEFASMAGNALSGAAEAVFDGFQRKQKGRPSGGPKDFRGVFGSFIRSEADAAVGRVKVEDPAMREAVLVEAAAKALLSAAEVPGADRLAGAVSVERARELSGFMSGVREAVEWEHGVSAWSGKRLPAAELERRRVELDPLHVYAARRLAADPVGNDLSRLARGWMDDPAATALKRARAAGMER